MGAQVVATLPAARGARPLRILVAEDNRVNQLVAQGLLTRLGHHVRVVANGHEAVEAIRREDFDVVFMDVHMPEMDGFQATGAIRADERETGRHLRIIAMTASAMTGDRERCIASGMDGYLSKPIKSGELDALVGAASGPDQERADPAAVTR